MIYSRHILSSVKYLTNIVDELSELYNYNYKVYNKDVKYIYIRVNFEKNVCREGISLADKDISYNLQKYFNSSVIDFREKTITYSCVSFL